MESIREQDRSIIPLEYSLPRLRKKFLETGESQGWLYTDAPIVLAVSGGSDSVAMLWFFSVFRPENIVAAHLDHGIRGEEAREDARFTAELARKLGVRFVSKSLPVPEMLKKGESLEDGARRIRYSFLEEVRKNLGARGIGVAHTSDDSAETFIHNLFRGSGVRGLAGIPPKRGYIFRPMLGWSRQFLRDLLILRGIPWRDDSTNEDTSHMRNRIRNIVIPLVEREINSSARAHVLGVAEDIAWYRKKEEEAGEDLVRACAVSLPFCSYACSSSFLKGLDEGGGALFIRAAGRALGLKTLSRERTESLRRLFHTNGFWCFQWQRDMFVFGSSPFVTWVDPAILNGPESRAATLALEGGQGEFFWNGWTFSWKKTRGEACYGGWMRAVIPLDEKLEILPLSRLDAAERPKAPLWGRDVFPVLSSGSFRWVPFWGRRAAVSFEERRREALCVTAGFPKISCEKGKENEL